jgi:hypothetical protein
VLGAGSSSDAVAKAVLEHHRTRAVPSAPGARVHADRRSVRFVGKDPDGDGAALAADSSKFLNQSSTDAEGRISGITAISFRKSSGRCRNERSRRPTKTLQARHLRARATGGAVHQRGTASSSSTSKSNARRNRATSASSPGRAHRTDPRSPDRIAESFPYRLAAAQTSQRTSRSVDNVA